MAARLAGTDVGPDWNTTFKRQTPETLTILRNIFVGSKLRKQSLGERPDPSLDKRIAEVESKIFLAVSKKLQPIDKSEHKTVRPLPLNEKSYQGQVLILVDANCASSCESSLNALKAYPRAKSVGENTAGYYHFGDVGVVLLPKSGIILKVPTKYSKYADGRIYDKVGFPPDIQVEPGKDAMAEAMAILNREL